MLNAQTLHCSIELVSPAQVSCWSHSLCCCLLSLL